MHCMSDDPSRVALVQILANQRKESAVALPGGRGHRYRARDDRHSKSLRAACKGLGLRQVFTKPYTPTTNGNAERFVQTALREWAYLAAITTRINDRPR
jgi:transposase InsO family protein